MNFAHKCWLWFLGREVPAEPEKPKEPSLFERVAKKLAAIGGYKGSEDNYRRQLLADAEVYANMTRKAAPPREADSSHLRDYQRKMLQETYRNMSRGIPPMPPFPKMPSLPPLPPMPPFPKMPQMRIIADEAHRLRETPQDAAARMERYYASISSGGSWPIANHGKLEPRMQNSVDAVINGILNAESLDNIADYLSDSNDAFVDAFRGFADADDTDGEDW